MAVNYSQTAINDRLLGVIAAIDGGATNGSLLLMAGSILVSTIQLARPCGTVNGGVLTFAGTPLLDPSAAATGNVDSAIIQDGNGSTMVSGLTVGIPLSASVDIVISNGLNSTLVTAGQTVELLAAQITGS